MGTLGDKFMPADFQDFIHGKGALSFPKVLQWKLNKL
jgi:hypothetical protein